MRIKILLILFLFSVLGAFLSYRGIYLPKEPTSKKEVVFYIVKGEGTKEIAFNLEKQGLVRSGFLFRIYTLFKGVSGKLQAGEYSISPTMTIPEIARKFVLGDIAKVVITIPEGLNLREIIQKLSGSYPNSSDIEKMKINDFWDDPEFLKGVPAQTSLEGFLFPDTYYFFYDSDIEEVVKEMLKNFDKKLTPDLREEINRQGKTIFKIITMASMIEKEVKTFQDKKLVSGILWKRLENGIPLQVDATIIYITGKKTTDPEGVASRPYGARISKEETQIDSPYNTYKYKGLPLGPISNPGLDSILASIYPEENAFWYYLSTPEGETIFSKTLEEHNIAKAKYLK